VIGVGATGAEGEIFVRREAVELAAARDSTGEAEDLFAAVVFAAVVFAAEVLPGASETRRVAIGPPASAEMAGRMEALDAGGALPGESWPDAREPRRGADGPAAAVGVTDGTALLDGDAALA